MKTTMVDNLAELAAEQASLEEELIELQLEKEAKEARLEEIYAILEQYSEDE